MTSQHLLESITITGNVNREIIFSLYENVSENQTSVHFVPRQNPNDF